MTAALLPKPDRLVRVWDRDFRLVHAFRADEDYPDGLPLDHPVARHIQDAVRVGGRSNVYLSIDENDDRTVEQLDLVEIVKHDDTPRMVTHWR